MIERVGAAARGLDEDAHLALDLLLADVFAERAWPDRTIDQFLITTPGGTDQTLLTHRPVHSRAAPCSAPRIISSVLPFGSAFLSKRVASLGR